MCGFYHSLDRGNTLFLRRKGIALSMEQPIIIEPVGAGRPWGPQSAAVLQQAQEALPFDACLFGIVSLPHPRPDELLLVDGWSGPELERLMDPSAPGDPLLVAAAREGAAVASAERTDLAPSRAKKCQVMAVALCDAPDDDRYWLWLMCRRGRGFVEADKQIAMLMVRRWQAQFSSAEIEPVGRVVLGHDDRVLAADLSTRIAATRDDRLLDQLVTAFRPIVAQRLPDLEAGATCDLALRVDGRDYWIRFTRSAAVDGQAGTHWVLEIRTLADGDLPIVGVVPDDRIARAIAYLHQAYPESPSLAQISHQAHMSPFHFHRLFSRQADISPKHYLQKKQLQVAKWLLRSSKYSIGSIAAHTGFASHGHFTSTFHRLIGVSPTQYRQQD